MNSGDLLPDWASLADILEGAMFPNWGVVRCHDEEFMYEQ